MRGILEERAIVKMNTTITKKIHKNAALPRIKVKSRSLAKIPMEMVGMEATLKLMKKDIVKIFLMEMSFWLS